MSWSSVTVVLKAKRMPFRCRNQSQQSLSSSCPRAWRSRTVFPEHILRVMLRNLDSENFCPVAQPGGWRGHAPPKLGSQENSWLRRWAKYTKLCMVWHPNILNNCYELSGGYPPPRTTHQGSASGPRWGTSVFQTPCVPTSKFLLRHCFCLFLHPPVRTM